MMKRKMMAAVLTMAMAATMIGGCGNSTDTSNAGNSTNKTEIYIIPYSEPEEIMRVALEAPASAQSENKEKENIIDFRLAV